MRLTLLGSERRWPAKTRPRPGRPSIDRFGASVSVVVLAASTAAVLLLRQNLDDHVYRLAGTGQAETTGAATSR